MEGEDGHPLFCVIKIRIFCLLESPLQFEHDCIGCKANAYMPLNSVSQTVTDRAYTQLSLVHEEGPFDEPQVVVVVHYLLGRSLDLVMYALMPSYAASEMNRS